MAVLERMRWILIAVAVALIVCGVLLGRPAVGGGIVPPWAAVLAFGLGLAFGARNLLWRRPD